MVLANGRMKLEAILFYRPVFVVNRRTRFDIVTKISLVVMGIRSLAFFYGTVFGCGKLFAYPWAPLDYLSYRNINTRLNALMISDHKIYVFVWLLLVPVVRSFV